MRTSKGFTIIEVLIVITLISILSTFSIASYSQVQLQGRDAKRKADLANIKSALELYRSVKNSYPPTTSFPPSGAWGGVWSETIDGTPYTFINQVPSDPTASQSYCYVASGSAPSTFNLYAILESSGDRDRNTTDNVCLKTYNYKVTSPF